MPLFAIHCLDKPQSGALRAETRTSHLEYLASLEERIFAAGPLLDLEGAAMGSLMIVECIDRRQAYQFAAADPYSLSGLFQSVAITAWRRVYPVDSTQAAAKA